MVSGGLPDIAEYPSTPLQTSRAPLREARPENAVRYEILPDLSDIRFLVFRAGPLSRFGTIMSFSKNVHGEIFLAPDIHQSSFFIEIPIKDFLVDAEKARLDEGEIFFPNPMKTLSPEQPGICSVRTCWMPPIPEDRDQVACLDWASLGNGHHDENKNARCGARRRANAVENSNDRLVVTAFFSINQTDSASLQ